MSELLIQPTGQPGRILSSDGSVTISIPIQIRRRSGRKQITLPIGEQLKPTTQMPPPTSLQSALARGHRWLKMLELGEVTSLKAIAALEQVDERYVSRMINLTTLEPDMVAVILGVNIPDHLTILNMAVNPPVLWEEQRECFDIDQ
ncbi:MAG TPA: LacI family transcriptional regulator [Cellvibrionaceae bacterium]|nr:LacI family transcriptional regulator [Cellvibrionaceae bacterium]